jgi:23S rRNA (adenine2503-C2)-methyltransferase
METNIKDLSHEDLTQWLARYKQPPYRANQVRTWLFQKGATSFSHMTSLSIALRSLLEQHFSINCLQLQHKSHAQDDTDKFLFALQDGAAIETVLISDAHRLTLCLSTQVGCGFGCSFCATAQMGLKRNLRSCEIIDQILEVQRTIQNGRQITNLVFMGMGEPLANFEQTRAALDVITDSCSGMKFSPRRVTLSTVGLIPQIQRLMKESQVNLAISLHAATDPVRSKLMPINRKYALADLIECCRSLPIQRRRRITFEYLLIRGVNHAAEDAERLSSLLKGIRCKINLIPFNPYPGSSYRRPGATEVEKFSALLQRRGLQVNIRRPRGEDVQAACGQLQAQFRRQQGSLDINPNTWDVACNG